MAARRPKFKADYYGIGKMLTSPEMAAEMVRRAESAEQYARTIAPRETGQFKSSFYVLGTRTHGGVKESRAAGILGNDDPSAVAIEYGTRDTKAHRTLRRAMMEAMGD